jgi:hypothetical protein
MVPVRRLFAGLKALLRGRRVEQELDEELRAHLDTSVEAKIRAGMVQTRGALPALRPAVSKL